MKTITKYYIIQRSVADGYTTSWFFDDAETAELWSLPGYVTVSPVLSVSYTIDPSETAAALKAKIDETNATLARLQDDLASVVA